MGMTFTATGEPSNIPPRVKLDVATGVSGATFNSLTITQDGTPIRLQPPTGVESTTTYDYEMPFGTSVTYVASGAYLPFVAPEWSENWASLASWTADEPGWALGPGDTITSTTLGAIISRTTAATIQRLEVTDPANVTVALVDSDEGLVAGITMVDGVVTLISAEEPSGVSTDGTGSFALTLIDGVASLTAGDVSWSLTVPYSGSAIKVYLISAGGQFGDSGTSFSSVGDPDRIAIASGGNIYTLDIASKLVRKFNSAGVFQTSWSTTNTPNDIALDSSENVYVTDVPSKLVRKFNSTGTPSTTWSTTGVPAGIGIDSANAVYVYDQTANTIRKYTNTGTVTTSWSNIDPADSTNKQLAVLPGGTTVYTFADEADDDAGWVNTWTSTGTPINSWNTGQVDANLTVDSAGDFWLGEGGSANKYSGTTGGQVGGLSISPHTGAFVRATSTPGTVLVGDTSNDTVRTFATTTATVGVVEVTPAVTPVAFLETTSVTLTITEAWLIHPGQPTLSVSLSGANWRDTGLNVDSASSQQNTSRAATTLHQPVGRTRTVAVASGNRLEEEWTLVLIAPTLDDRTDVRAITNDQTPLLVRSPASFNWDLTDGYYAIGDVAYDRMTANLTQPYRRITLPLTPSDPPVVRVNVDRTWADVVEQNIDWDEVKFTYESWSDLVLGVS